MVEYKPWQHFKNTKSWLEQLGIPTKEAGNITPPPFPYQVYIDAEETAGPDNCPRALVIHDITVEQYEESRGRAHVEKLEGLLADGAISYEHAREWLNKETMWMDVFYFSIIEKTHQKKGM